MKSSVVNTPGCPILVGTSGFSFPEWIDSGFYPSGTKSGKMLEYYSRAFSVVELNYTWYQMARAETMEGLVRRVPETFYFAAKLTRTMTHEIDVDWQAQAGLYRQGISPLLSTGRLLAVLIQFPPSFQRTTKNRYHLALLLDVLQELPLAVEFRHRSWAQERVFSGLQERAVTLVAVDEPNLADLFPPLDIVTNPNLFYLRLHGRNSRDWYSGTMQKQFNYSYSTEELRWWSDEKIPSMARQCRRGVIFFNNHVAGQAVVNARAMIDILSTSSV